MDFLFLYGFFEFVWNFWIFFDFFGFLGFSGTFWFFGFLDFFCGGGGFLWILKLLKVTTKSYHGYDWTPKMA